MVSDRLHGEMQSGWVSDMLLVKGTQESLTIIWLMSWDTLISSKYMIVVMSVVATRKGHAKFLNDISFRMASYILRMYVVTSVSGNREQATVQCDMYKSNSYQLYFIYLIYLSYNQNDHSRSLTITHDHSRSLTITHDQLAFRKTP